MILCCKQQVSFEVTYTVIFIITDKISGRFTPPYIFTAWSLIKYKDITLTVTYTLLIGTISKAEKCLINNSTTQIMKVFTI